MNKEENIIKEFFAQLIAQIMINAVLMTLALHCAGNSGVINEICVRTAVVIVDVLVALFIKTIFG